MYHFLLDLDLELVALTFFLLVLIAIGAILVFHPESVDRWLD